MNYPEFHSTHSSQLPKQEREGFREKKWPNIKNVSIVTFKKEVVTVLKNLNSLAKDEGMNYFTLSGIQKNYPYILKENKIPIDVELVYDSELARYTDWPCHLDKDDKIFKKYLKVLVKKSVLNFIKFKNDNDSGLYFYGKIGLKGQKYLKKADYSPKKANPKRNVIYPFITFDKKIIEINKNKKLKPVIIEKDMAIFPFFYKLLLGFKDSGKDILNNDKLKKINKTVKHGGTQPTNKRSRNESVRFTDRMKNLNERIKNYHLTRIIKLKKISSQNYTLQICFDSEKIIKR